MDGASAESEGAPNARTTARWRGVARSLPTPVAERLDALARTGDLREAFFFTEALLRYVCLIVKSAYLAQPSVDLTINELIFQHLFRPSMGDWRDFLVRLPENWTAKLVPRGMQKLLGLLRDEATGEIVRLRNAAHGHAGGVLPDSIQRAVWRETAPTMARLIGAAEGLAEHRLVVRHAERDVWLLLRGPEPDLATAVAPPVIDDSAPGAVVFSGAADLALFPLLAGTCDDFRADVAPPDEPPPLFIFDGVDTRSKRLVYLTRCGRGRAPGWFGDYKRRVEEKQIPLSPAPLADFTRDELASRFTDALSLEILRRRIAGTWFDVDEELDPTIRGLLSDALASPARVVLVHGDPGVGKTTHALSFARDCTAGGGLGLFLDARQWFSERTTPAPVALRLAVEATLGVLGKAGRTLHAAADLLAERGRRLVVVLDGLDELGGTRFVTARLTQILEVLAPLMAARPEILLLLTMRTGAFDSIPRGEKSPLASLASFAYKATERGPLGGERAGDLLLPLASLEETERRWERLRRDLVGHQPRTPFGELPEPIRQACRSARWMMRALATFDGREVASAGDATTLWEAMLEETALARSTRGLFLHRDQALVLDAATTLLADCPSGEISEEQLFADPALAPILARHREAEAMEALVTNAVLRLHSDSRSGFAPARVSFASHGIAVAAFLSTKPLVSIDIHALVTLAAHVEERPGHAAWRDAIVERLARLIASTDDVLPSLDPSLLAPALLRARQLGAGGVVRRSLSMPAAVRDECFERVERLAWSGDLVALLEPDAVAVLSLRRTELTRALVAWATRILRRREGQQKLQSWLEHLSSDRAELGEESLFLLAELHRDQGRWRRAEHYYTRWLDRAPAEAANRALVRASRGEARIWAGDASGALGDLAVAAAEMSEQASAFERSNVHLKAGVAARLVNEPVRALRELMVADAIARESGLRMEQAKVLLEMGLVASLLGDAEGAAERVERALELHRRHGYVKGVKKGWYCSGWLHEAAGRSGLAAHAYRQSLQLNQRYFDRLGLHLNHAALARVLRDREPEEAAVHARKAEDAAGRLGKEDFHVSSDVPGL